MINIQIHEVVSVKWDTKPGDPKAPRSLVVQTVQGEQRVTLFPARDIGETEDDDTQAS